MSVEEATDFVCQKCHSYIYSETPVPLAEKMSPSGVCSVCLGLWETPSLQQAIEKACEPYGGLDKNRFCTLPNHTPTVSIAGEIDLRYRARQQSMKKPFSVFLQDLKNHLHNKLDCILHDPQTRNNPPPIVSNAEQQGYLSVHVLCIPPKGQSFLDVSTDWSTSKRGRKRSRQRPFVTQGGDPRVNLEHRLHSEGYQWLPMADADSIPKPSSLLPPTTPMEFHVAVFRRPIYLLGCYTKNRRDVSQTPFVVFDQDKESKTLGVTSVEAEIVRPIEKLLGVSPWNNPMEESVKYGMCKFHASGREDMDVRMLIRPNLSNITGRPFCIQMIDALRPIENENQLKDIVDTINAGNGEASPSWYGTNPLGVGVAPTLRVVPSSVFSSLQADTESKVKHYGCHCWSEKELPENWNFQLDNPPLTIQQRTPIRVLHRRSNVTRERQILAASATRVDSHHFRLELSAQAGTYIKEFVHGDLGRTIPNMASLLGNKTNILLLDCEGIEMDDLAD